MASTLFRLRVFAFGCCTLLFAAVAAADEWPQWRGPHRDGQWRETGLVERFAQPKLEILWRAPVGSGYSGPTVADGRVFVTDRLVEPEQVERVHCFDWQLGTTIWSYSYPCEYSISYDAGPRACVTIDDGRAYALGAMGHLHCFDAGTGAILWKRDLNAEYHLVSSQRMPIWGIASAPLVIDDLLILHVGGENACIVALDKRSGEEQWRALNDRASYSAPILIQQGGRQVVICWTGDSLAGLAPETGRTLWRRPFPPSRMPIGIATPLFSGEQLFVTSFYDGSLMLRLDQKKPAFAEMWRSVGPDERHTEGLHSIISTPIQIKDHLYGVDSYGELRCLRADTGQRIWADQTATPRSRWSTIHMVQNADKVWMFNERGELIISRLSPAGFEEISRASLIEPTQNQLRRRGGVCWSHPAFAYRHIFARNDKEIVCASLEAK